MCLGLAPVGVWLGTHVYRSSGALRGAAGLSMTALAGSVVMFAPGFAIGAVMWRRRADVGLARGLAGVLGAGALVSWLVWWVWVADPTLGRIAAGVAYVVAAVAITTATGVALRTLARVAAVVLLAVTTAVMCMSMLTVHGGMADSALLSERSVFGTADNLFPWVWETRADARQDLRPKALGWPLADRPPLQAAVTMPVYALSADRSFGYQVSSAVVDGLSVVAMVAIFVAIGLRRRRLLGAWALVTFTGFLVPNVIFVYPKLYSAALSLLAIALLLDVGTHAMDTTDWGIVGLLAAASLMAHPGGAYAALSLAVVVVALGIPTRLWRRLGAAAVGAAAMAVPWIIYRTWFNTTGSAELEWHLAGVMGPQHGSLLHLMRERYAALGVRGWLRHRYDNIAALFDVRLLLGTDHDGLGLRLRILRTQESAVAWGGGLLLLASPLLLLRRRIPRAVYVLGAATLVPLVVWVIVEFGPPIALTSTFNGSYAIVLLLAVTLASGAAFALSDRLLGAFVAVQVALCLWVTYPMGPTNLCHDMCMPANYPADLATGGRLLVPIALVGLLAAAASIQCLLWSTARPSSPAFEPTTTPEGRGPHTTTPRRPSLTTP